MRLTKSMKEIIVERIIDDVPQIDYNEMARVYIQTAYIKKLPPAIRAIAENKDLKHHLDGTYIYLPGHLMNPRVPGKFDSSEPLPALKEQLDEWATLAKEQNSAKNIMRRSLETVFAGIGTHKQALEILPEFEKYLPEVDAKLANLPVVINIIPSLMQMGWPKNQKPAAKAIKLRKKAA